MSLRPAALPSEENLAAAYVRGDPRVRACFSFSPDDQGLLARRDWLRGREYPRAALSALLVRYQLGLGAPEAAQQAAADLARPGTLAVLAGQQPGLLTGPLYTVYKALAAILLARRAEALAGCRVVPVFWVASEDHDIAEVDHIHVPGLAEATKVTLPLAGSGGSVGALGLSGADACFRELEQALPPSEFTPTLLAQARAEAGASKDLGEWFARMLLRLFGRHGLVVVDSMDPALRGLQRPVLCRCLDEPAAVARAVRDGTEAVAALGYPPQVEKAADAANFFTYMDGRRLPVAFGERGFELGQAAWPAAELRKRLESDPCLFSPGVLLRPICQDSVFPTLSTVSGPGEQGYQAQLGPVYRHFGLEAPVVWPRPRLTVLEPHLAGQFADLGATLTSLLRGGEGLKQELMNRAGFTDQVGAFVQLRADLAAAYGALAGRLVGDPALDQLIRGHLTRVLDQAGWLEDKSRWHFEQRHRILLGRVEKLAANVYPLGRPQERVFSWIGYAARYGPAWLEGALDPTVLGSEHHLYTPQQLPAR
ncbi:MAG: bacillithiol biosynthesis cysteine-adding enzyme BshC [Bacillota bacterium]